MNGKYVTTSLVFLLIVSTMIPVIFGLGPEFVMTIYVDDDNAEVTWDNNSDGDLKDLVVLVK